MGQSTDSPPIVMNILLSLCVLVGACSAGPYYYAVPQQQEYDEILVRVPRQAQVNRPSYLLPSDDQVLAADSTYSQPAAPVGRVKIQTYRGPSDGGEYGFAPWGYYNTQPADLSKGHH